MRPCDVPAWPVPTTRSGRALAWVAGCPPWAWPLAQAAALWPHWRWAAARVADGSDDPLGLAALAAFAALVVRAAPRLSARPHLGWWAVSATATVAATASLGSVPPLAGAVLAALAVASGVRAFLPPGHPALAWFGLAVLALPVVSSLQFYAGFPLRVVTAQLSTWALQAAGLAAARAGTAMVVEGRLVIVDAPCSGVQMVWLAYFCACAVAAFAHLPDRTFLARLPAAGALVLVGNAVRNTVLVACEGTGRGLSEVAHEAVGLAVLAAVCAGVVGVMRGGRHAHR